MADQIISCPHCSQELSIAEEYLGMEVECPSCNRNFVADVPESAAPSENNTENKSAFLLNKLKNSAANIGAAAAQAASNINNKLNEIQANENDIDDLEYEAKINRIKNGIPVRKIFKIVSFCLIAFLAISFAIVTKYLYGIVFLSTVVIIWAAIFGVILLSTYKKLANQKGAKKKTDTPIERKRKTLAAFLSGITEADGMKNIYRDFQDIRKQDFEHINQLDVLPRFGKSANQLVADSHTLHSPVIFGDCKYKFNDNGNFIYDKEEVTKIYTFEDQLLVFTSLWDYTTGELYNERSEAFFFKDITDISTTNNYETIKIVNLVTPPPPEIKPFPVKKYWISFAIYLIIWFICAIMWRDPQNVDEIFDCVGLLVVLSGVALCFLLWPLIYDIRNLKKIIPVTEENIKRVRASETFSITSSSGRSIGMTILCNGWFEANNGKFDGRTDGEKIIHAIRKMIEEKKVAANE